MNNEAKAVTRMRIERMVITKADGTVIDLGRPGTINFQIRRRVYIWRNRNLLKEGIS